MKFMLTYTLIFFLIFTGLLFAQHKYEFIHKYKIIHITFITGLLLTVVFSILKI